MGLILKVSAAFIALLILSLIVFRVLGFEVGVRLSQNNFTGQIANSTVTSWGLAVLILFELFVVALLLSGT